VSKVPVILLLIFFSIGASAAKYYKWQDEKGLTHYTAIAPEGRTNEVINTRTGGYKPFADEKPSGTPKRGTPSSKPKPTTQPATKTDPQTKQQLAKARKQQEENCEVTRKNLETLNIRARIRINDAETGELRFLTPDEHASMKKESQEHLDEFCK
jgi:uncharacterized protein DUF4124